VGVTKLLKLGRRTIKVHLPGEVQAIKTNNRTIKRSTRHFLPTENFELTPGRKTEYSLSTASRPATGHTESPEQKIPGAIFRGINGRSVQLTTHLHLSSRSRASEGISPLPTLFKFFHHKPDVALGVPGV
jgi:hypothetical protein